MAESQVTMSADDLRMHVRGRVPTAPGHPAIAFVFSGEGGNWIGMGAELFRAEPVFRKSIETADAALRQFCDWRIGDVLTADASRLNEIDVLHPTFTAYQIALTEQLRSWGVRPDAVIGHSIGEAAAAHVAGALSLTDALRVQALRSQLLVPTLGQGGRMAFAELSLEEAERVVLQYHGRIVVGLSLGPRSIVFSGEEQAIREVSAKLTSEGVFSRIVKVPLAPHSATQDAIKDGLFAAFAAVKPSRLELPYFSSVRPRFGWRAEDGLAMGAEYWWENSRNPALFAAATSEALAAGFKIFVELSPHPILNEPIRQSIAHAGRSAIVISPLLREKSEVACLHDALAELRAAGVPVESPKAAPTESRASTRGAAVFGAALRAATADGRNREIAALVPTRKSDEPLRNATCVDDRRIEATLSDGKRVSVASLRMEPRADVPALDEVFRTSPFESTRPLAPAAPARMTALAIGPSAAIAAFSLSAPSFESLFTAVEQTISAAGGTEGAIVNVIRAVVQDEIPRAPTCRATFTIDAATKTLIFRAWIDGVAFVSGTFEPTRNMAETAPLRAEVLRDPATAERKIAMLVCSTCAKILRVPAVDATVSLVRLGVDSLGALELRNVLHAQLGVAIDTPALLTFDSLDAIARSALAAMREGDASAHSAVGEWGSAVPLSREQRRFFHLSKVDPRNAEAYGTAVIRFSGRVDEDAIVAALEQMVDHHELLRSRVVVQGATALQHVEDVVRIPIVRVDLRELPENERHAELQRLIDAEAEVAIPIDVARAPLVRARLVRLAESEVALLVRFHHIVIDYWSTNIFAIDVGHHYLARLYGLPPPPRPGAPYAVHVADELALEGSDRYAARLAFWRKQLAGAPGAIRLPTDRERPERHTLRAESVTATLSEKLYERIREVGQRASATTYATLLAAFSAVLERFSGDDDILIGSPIAARDRQELERTIGPIIAWTVLRMRGSNRVPFSEACAQAMRVVMEGYENRVALEHLVELSPAYHRDRNPLFQVLFNHLDKESSLGFEDSRIAFDVLEFRTTHFDLGMSVEKTGSSVELRLTYYADIFERETASALLDAYVGVLEHVAQDAQRTATSAGVWPAALTRSREKTKPRALTPADEASGASTIAIAATFTAEPLEKTIAFWSKTLGLRQKVAFAPYNQVFQEILGQGVLAANEKGPNVVLVRMEDMGAEPERALDDLVRGLGEFAGRRKAPTIVVVCPPSPGAAARSAELEASFVRALSAVRSATVFSSSDVLDLYPVASYDDEDLYRQAKAPYTEAFYAGLATFLVRKIHLLSRTPYKVIAIDCDNTLWDGVCGEDGAAGVLVDEHRCTLQKFLVDQTEKGMLVCLASKNVEADVDAVFETKALMPLRREHIVARRVNWLPKSENLKSLASSLGVGLNSFVFVDDNPVECEEVRANAPDALVLALPVAEKERVGEILKHYWPFDRLTVTEEDRKRTLMYAQSAARSEARKSTTSFRDFLASLELEITLKDLSAETVPRVAQLTQRTNQFNTTTMRRTEDDVRALLSETAHCFTVEVKDRFGEYGLVGAAFHRVDGDALIVESVVLSCRALGRGVEHRMIARLGEIASAQGLRRVVVHFVPSAKNTPARSFLDGAGALRVDDTYVFSVEAATAMRFAPSDEMPAAVVDEKEGGGGAAKSAAQTTPERIWERIARTMHDASEIVRLVESGAKSARPDFGTPYVVPRGDVETRLASIWEHVLQVDRVGRDDDFFELGGDSIKAIQILARAREAGLRIELNQLLDQRTVARLAASTTEATQQLAFQLPKLPIPPNCEDAYPLASNQSLMLEHYSAQTGAYHFQSWMEFEDRTGPVDTGLMRDAYCKVAARQHVMRTIVTGGAQAVRRDYEPLVTELDLGGLEPQEVEQRVSELFARDRERPFQPEVNVSPRVVVVRTSESRIGHFTSGHHAFGDAWGAFNMLNVVFEVYAASKRGDTKAAEELARGSYGTANVYKEYVALEAQTAHDARAREFWTQQFAGWSRKTGTAPAATAPPFVGEVALGERVATAARKYARDNRIGIKAVLLAAYARALTKALGTPAACVGIVTNGRTERLSDPLRAFGLFWRFMPLIVAAGGDARRIHDALTAADVNALFPIDEIMKMTGGDPIDATFNYVQFHGAAWEGAQSPVVLRQTRVDDTFHYPINLKATLAKSEDELRLTVTMFPERWSASATETFLDDYVAALRAIIS